MSYTTTITQSGQITISKAAREALGVRTGDRVFVDIESGQVIIKRRLSDDEFFSAIDEMDKKYHINSPKIDATEAVRLYREGKVPAVNRYYRNKFKI